MCGIVGLHLKGDRYSERLGELLAGMFVQVRERGPDSGGVGVYADDGLTVLKEVGDPAELVGRFGLAGRSGYRAIGHTRMATESAITTEHSHPFFVEPDLCLVHNGSFANHDTIRRELAAEGIAFQTDNDSEVAARFVGWRLGQGDDLDKALRLVCDRFDGFYTLLVTTSTRFAVVRDAIACKPALIAETGDWVAMASEYRALVGLPGIEHARVFEPGPAEVYLWTR
jgi:glutamate synthase domain-containing protein 1